MACFSTQLQVPTFTCGGAVRLRLQQVLGMELMDLRCDTACNKNTSKKLSAK